MLWGAPLCFILQARPVKMWSKILFYMITDPPSFVLSLLPAPQQAILALDMEKSFAALYSPGEEKLAEKSAPKPDADEEEEEEEQDVEEDEDDEEEEGEEDEDDEEYDSEDEE
jgi:nucleosome binding factor SPN SPT16 subunit